MAFAVSTLATLLFIVASSLPEHIYGDEACENAAIATYCASVVTDIGSANLDAIKSAMNSDEEDDQTGAKVITLIQQTDLTKSENISTYTQTLVDAIVACQSTEVWQSTFGSGEQRVCDIFSTVYEEKQISLPQNFPQTCP